ncbi:uncharacterized protein [Lepeophtheirus salmonis]
MSRDEALEAKKKDTRETQRNKRMFGNLMGTLQKFKREETRVLSSTREAKKREVEKKIEDRSEKEREDARRQKTELLAERSRKQKEIRLLQIQMKRVEEFEVWETSKRRQMGFIRTKTGPPLFYLPKVHNDQSMTALEETMDTIEEEIKLTKSKFEEDLLKMEHRLDSEGSMSEDDDEEFAEKPKSIISKPQSVNGSNIEHNGKQVIEEEKTIKIVVDNKDAVANVCHRVPNENKHPIVINIDEVHAHSEKENGQDSAIKTEKTEDAPIKSKSDPSLKVGVKRQLDKSRVTLAPKVEANEKVSDHIDAAKKKDKTKSLKDEKYIHEHLEKPREKSPLPPKQPDSLKNHQQEEKESKKFTDAKKRSSKVNERPSRSSKNVKQSKPKGRSSSSTSYSSSSSSSSYTSSSSDSSSSDDEEKNRRSKKNTKKVSNTKKRRRRSHSSSSR